MSSQLSHAEYQRVYRARRNSKGMCYRCRRPNSPGNTLCEYHLKELRDKRTARIAKGACPCGKPRQANRRACADCLAKSCKATERKSSAWKEQGLCVLCGGEVEPDRTMCVKHLAMLRDRARVRNKERIAAGLCVQCGKPSEFKQQRCVSCSQPYRKGDPNPIRKLQASARDTEKREAEDREALEIRTFIESWIYLIKKPRDRAVLRVRYGYTHTTSHTLAETGDLFEIGRERVRQIADKSMLRLIGMKQEADLPPGVAKLKRDLDRYPLMLNERLRARSLALQAIKAGRIPKEPCKRCGNDKAEAHHPDYSKPLEVEWLCRQCHGKEHQRLRQNKAA